MSNTLFQLIKSLEKSEKRNFKLYVQRDDLKFVKVFDVMDKMDYYDEALLLKKANFIKKEQLSNIKAHLYKQVLSSLRLISDQDNIDISLHEQMGHARILYNKGLYLQALKMLDKLKAAARAHEQLSYLQQALFFEKKIEALFITRSMKERAQELAKESEEVNDQLAEISKLSNRSLKLYSWYIDHGVARNEKDLSDLKSLKPVASGQKPIGFYQQLYYNQSQCWYRFISQDFLLHYRYSLSWVELFEQYPAFKKIETAAYIKGMHNLLSACFYLRDTARLKKYISRFEELIIKDDNGRILYYQYLYAAKINLYFLRGEFTNGLRLVPKLEELIEQYSVYLDNHRVLVYYYKIACMYFGSGDNGKAVDYLNKIINQKVNLRKDLQCYARLLHLIAHYELGNFDLLEYLIKSVYRFMAKMENLGNVEKAILAFLRKSFRSKPVFESLLLNLKQYEGQRLEARAFVYLDIISWLEAKINNIKVEVLIKQKSSNSAILLFR